MALDAICSECGRILEEAFRYCPWCGASRDRDGLSSLVEGACGKIESLYRTGMDSRISDMEARLGEMENELNRILS